MTDNTAQTLTLQVRGMSCAGCEQRIGTALRRLDGVVEATADHTSGQVRVRFDPAGTDRGAVLDRIVLAGYTLDDTDTDSRFLHCSGPLMVRSCGSTRCTRMTSPPSSMTAEL